MPANGEAMIQKQCINLPKIEIPGYFEVTVHGDKMVSKPMCS